MTTVFLCEGSHPHVPGVIRSLHATKAGADAAAHALCKTLLADLGLAAKHPDPADWPKELKRIQKHMKPVGGYGDVAILEMEVQS